MTGPHSIKKLDSMCVFEIFLEVYYLFLVSCYSTSISFVKNKVSATLLVELDMDYVARFALGMFVTWHENIL